MLDRGNKTFICSVVFLDIVGYSEKPVAAQIRMKDQFNDLLSEAIRDIAVNDRIIVDTGDGAAISFISDPEEALFVALSLRDAVTGANPTEQTQLSIRIGINLGPVRLVKDINGQPNIIGDGINVAQRVMSFGQPEQILVSRSYYEVVSRLSEEYVQLFAYEGSHTDKHVREHEVYTVGAGGKPRRPAARTMPSPGPAVKESAKAPLNFTLAIGKKSLIAGAVALTAAVVLAAYLFYRHPRENEPAPAADKPIITEPITTEANKPRPVAGVASQERKPSRTAAAEPAAPRALPAVIRFAITPWGEVYIDNKSYGVSPPLRETKLTPGKHRIEIRNSKFPSYVKTVEVKSEQQVKIKYKFK